MSYSTVVEADEYVSTRYISTDPVRTRWEGLTEDDKQALLNKSMDIINNLPLTGCKANADQENAFPRFGQEEIPDAVKFAEIELALAYADSDSVADVDHYRKMVQYGISSYSIGNFSEALLTYSKNGLELQYGVISTQAERLLTPWLSGGFCFE